MLRYVKRHRTWTTFTTKKRERGSETRMRMSDPMVMNIAQSPAPSSHPGRLHNINIRSQLYLRHRHSAILAAIKLIAVTLSPGFLAAATIIQYCDILSGRNLAKHRQYEFVKLKNKEGICFGKNKNSRYWKYKNIIWTFSCFLR